MMRGDVRFHNEGEKFAVSTNTETERDFLDGCAAALASLEPSANQLARWLPLVVDVAAKLRGYKSDVIERRLIVAGAWLPGDTVAVVADGKLFADQVVGRVEQQEVSQQQEVSHG